MKKLTFLSVLLIAVSSLTGCSNVRAAFRVFMPGGVTAADAEWSGVAGAPTSIVAAITAGADPKVVEALRILQAFGGLPLGDLLPVTPTGETSPRYVVCFQEWAAVCEAVPINAEVHFAGSPAGLGVLWTPKRLTFSKPPQ